jgi:hypothetical protein
MNIQSRMLRCIIRRINKPTPRIIVIYPVLWIGEYIVDLAASCPHPILRSMFASYLFIWGNWNDKRYLKRIVSGQRLPTEDSRKSRAGYTLSVSKERRCKVPIGCCSLANKRRKYRRQDWWQSASERTQFPHAFIEPWHSEFAFECLIQLFPQNPWRSRFPPSQRGWSSRRECRFFYT